MSLLYAKCYSLERRLYKDKIFNLMEPVGDPNGVPGDIILQPVNISIPYNEDTLVTNIPELNQHIKAFDKLELFNFNKSQEQVKSVKLNDIKIPTVKEFMIDYVGLNKFKYFKPEHYKNLNLNLIYSEESLNSIKNNLSIVDDGSGILKLKNSKANSYIYYKFKDLSFLFRGRYYDGDNMNYRTETIYELNPSILGTEITSVEQYMNYTFDKYLSNYSPLLACSNEKYEFGSSQLLMYFLHNIHTEYGETYPVYPKMVASEGPNIPSNFTTLNQYIADNPDIKLEDIVVVEIDMEYEAFLYLKIDEYMSNVGSFTPSNIISSKTYFEKHEPSYYNFYNPTKRFMTGTLEYPGDMMRLPLFLDPSTRAGMTQDEADRLALHIKSISIEKYFKNY